MSGFCCAFAKKGGKQLKPAAAKINAKLNADRTERNYAAPVPVSIRKDYRTLTNVAHTAAIPAPTST